MAASVRVTQFALRTTNGTTDITVSGEGDCKGAVFICSGGVTNGTVRTTSKHSIGWIDDDGDEAVGVAGASEDNKSSSDTYYSWSSTYCISMHDDGGNTIDGQYSFDSFITDGVRITTTNPSATAHLCTVILFFGSDITTEAGTITPSSAVDVEDTVNIGQDSDLLFWSHRDTNASADSAGNNAIFNLAVSTFDGSTIKQRGTRVFDVDGKSTTEIRQNTGDRLDYNYGGLNDINRAMECTTMDGDEVGITSREGTAPNDRPYRFLSVNFGGQLEARVEALTLPTSGDLTSSGYGDITPDLALLLFMEDDAQVNETGGFETARDDMTVVGVMDGTGEYSMATSSEDNVGTSNTASVANNNVLYATDPTDSVAVDGDFSSFSEGGFEVTMNTNPGSSMAGWGLVIGSAAAAGARRSRSTFVTRRAHQARIRM